MMGMKADREEGGKTVLIYRCSSYYTGKALEDMDLDELDELEDEEEERILDQYRRQRMAQMKELQAKSRFGDVREISAEDYIAQVCRNGATKKVQT